jgi:hypothetical protein
MFDTGLRPGTMWGLRGVHIDPVEVEGLREKLSMRPRERRVVDYGWTDPSNLWLAVRLPNLTAVSFTQGIPVAILPYVASRQFRARTKPIGIRIEAARSERSESIPAD